MFGINAQDALGLMEDMTVLRGREASRQRQLNAQVDENTAMVGAFVAIKQRDNKLQEMDTRLRDTMSGWHGAVAACKADSEVIGIAVREIARLSGKNEKDMKVLMDTIRSRAYDKKIDEYIQSGGISTDPRIDEQLCPSWYIPDSCV